MIRSGVPRALIASASFRTARSNTELMRSCDGGRGPQDASAARCLASVVPIQRLPSRIELMFFSTLAWRYCGAMVWVVAIVAPPSRRYADHWCRCPGQSMPSRHTRREQAYSSVADSLDGRSSPPRAANGQRNGLAIAAPIAHTAGIGSISWTDNHVAEGGSQSSVRHPCRHLSS
jgi:hypothetical protein